MVLRSICGKLFLGLLLSASSLVLAETPRVDRWRAEWVTAPGEAEAGSWWCFRKEIDVADTEVASVARIACDSKYWLWINDRLVVFEGQPKRGPNREDTYYDEVDLTGAFQTGLNTIAVLVWHFGKEGMSHKNSGVAGLLFDAQVGEQRVLSDASWRALRHPAYLGTGEPRPNWRLPESNIGYDARLDPGPWRSEGFDDSTWPAAVERGRPPTSPWNRLVRRPIPLWKRSDLHEYENAGELPAVASGEPIIARLPHNAQVTPYLEIETEAGQLIDIRTDNFRGGGEPNVRGEYTTKAGRQAYESLGWMNGHEVIYKIPAGVKIKALKYRESGYDTELAGSFRCSDERLNTLWRKAQRTLYVNMRDTYFDCPGRERAQWWGDVTLEFQQAFYALDRRSDALAKKGILELAAWQKPDNALFSPVPAGGWDQELPMQMLASVGRYGFWEYYRHTGDRETIERVYPAVNRYLQLWSTRGDGLVVHRKGGWTWGDWGKNKDLPLLYNAWFYLALDGRSRMADLLGDKEQVIKDRETMLRLAKAFNANFWTEHGYRSPGHEGPIDERGSALAVVAGIADPAKHGKLREVLVEQRHASPYMEKYVLEALFRLGATDAAIDRMLERYAPMIDSPITTLWEGWGIGPDGYGGGSYNHAWGGGPLTLLSQYVAGIDPLEPGYLSVAIRPNLGRLDWVEAEVASPRGPIQVKARRIAGSLIPQAVGPVGVDLQLAPAQDKSPEEISGSRSVLIPESPARHGVDPPSSERSAARVR